MRQGLRDTAVPNGRKLGKGYTEEVYSMQDVRVVIDSYAYKSWTGVVCELTVVNKSNVVAWSDLRSTPPQEKGAVQGCHDQ